MFFKLVCKNGKSSYKENGIYFLSLVISIIAFYVILSLEKQDVMLFLKEMESDAVERLFLLIKGVYGVSLFMIFFMIYFAQKYQLQRRNHEFGMLLMLGMPRKSLFGMLMIEDFYTSGLSILIGLPVEVILSEGVSLVTAKLVGMGIIGHRFSFSLQAVVVTAIGFCVIKMTANLLLSAKIVRNEPGNLMREQVEQIYKKIHWIREMIGIVSGCLCLIAAYMIAYTKGIAFYQVKWMTIVIVLGMIGTYWALKGICLLVRIILCHRKKKPVLHTFTFRQLQENVFGKCMSLTIASLLVLMAVICMAYGIAVSVLQAKSYEHGMDYTFESYDEETEKKMMTLTGDASVKDIIGKWVTVKISFLPIYNYDDEVQAVSYDPSDVMECAKRLNEEDWEAFDQTSFYYGVFSEDSGMLNSPYLIRISDWNAYLKKELIEKNGLMQAIRIGNTLFDLKGLMYENYLQNIGRQLFYIVAASYLTIYFAFIFLLIANTVISLQFLMQEKKTRSRYRTLIRLGSRYEYLCQSAKSQISWYFAMPVGLALVSSIVGTLVLFRTMLPEILLGKLTVLTGIAGAVILVLGVVECVYMRQVIKLSRQNIDQMMSIVREDC